LLHLVGYLFELSTNSQSSKSFVGKINGKNIINNIINNNNKLLYNIIYKYL